MICAESLTPKTSQLNFDQTIEFLEPRDLPPRAGAICQSASDYNAQKTALESACRELGTHCTYQIKALINKSKGF